MKRVWIFIKSWWPIWLTTFFIVLVISVVINILRGDLELSYALFAVCTFLLAIITAFSIESNRKIAKERIEGERAKERRERDIGLLNEIIEWVTDTLKIGPPAQSIIIVSSLDDESEQRLVQNALITLRNDFRASSAVSVYICRTGLAFGEKLKSSINTLDTDIRKQDELIEGCIKIVNRRATGEFDKAWDEFIDNWEKLSESAVNVIDEAVIEKFTILNI